MGLGLSALGVAQMAAVMTACFTAALMINTVAAPYVQNTAREVWVSRAHNIKQLPDALGAAPAGESLSVSATDLDTRDLAYSQDSITVHGSEGTSIKTDYTGRLQVNATIQGSEGAPLKADSAGRLFVEYQTTTLDRLSTGTVTASNDVAGLNIQRHLAADAAANLIPANFLQFTDGTGTTGAANKRFFVASGTSFAGRGVIQSFRSLHTKHGQADVVRMSAYFSAPAAATSCGIGAFDIGNELSFGYNGLEFGIWHRYGGLAEVRRLEVVTGASGPETLTIFVDGESFALVTNESDIENLAYRIEEAARANLSSWVAESVGEFVFFTSTDDLQHTGGFNVSSDGVANATFTTITTGTPRQSQHIPVAEWSPGPPVGFNASLGHNYQITYVSEYGDARFYIGSVNGYTLVHEIVNDNVGTDMLIESQGMHLGMYAYQLQNNGTDVAVYARSIAGFSPKSPFIRNPRAIVRSQTATTTETQLFALRARRQVNGIVSQAEIQPLELFISTSNNNREVNVRIYSNPTPTGVRNWITSNDNLISQYDLSDITVTGGLLLDAGTASVNSQVQKSLLAIRVPPTLELVVTISTLSGSAATSGTLTWYEDIH